LVHSRDVLSKTISADMQEAERN